MFGILDPTIGSERDRIDYAPRPKSFRGLRVALVENTRKNSAPLLLELAQRLKDGHGIEVEVLLHKHQRAPLADSQLAELKGRTDFVIAGVGD